MAGGYSRGITSASTEIRSADRPARIVVAIPTELSRPTLCTSDTFKFINVENFATHYISRNGTLNLPLNYVCFLSYFEWSSSSWRV